MKNSRALHRPGMSGTLAAIAVALFSTAVFGDEVKLTLSGDMEVPPVKTMASGSGTLMVNPDMSVSGSIMTKGLNATMAHIHMAPMGKNGPVIIPLSKSGEYGWMVPAGAKLTAEQYQAYKAGDLYVNVHTDANKGGEIRGQLKP